MEEQKIIKSGMWQMANVVSFGIIQLLFIGILARYYSKTDWAIIAISNSIIQFSLIFSESGLGMALVNRSKVDDGHLSATTFFNFCTAIFFSLLFYFLAKPLAVLYKNADLENIVKATGLNFIIQAIGLTSMYMLQKNMKFKQLFYIEVPSNLVSSALGIYWAMIGWGPWAYVDSYIVMAVMEAAGYIYFNKQRVKSIFGFQKQHFQDLFSYGMGQTFNRLINSYFNNNDGVNFIVAKILQFSLVGLFDRTYRIMLLPARYVGNVIDRVLFPALSKVKDDDVKMLASFKKTLRLVATIVFPLSLILIIYSKEIVIILFGNKWLGDALIPLRILFCAIPFRVLQRVAASVLRSGGLVYKSAKIGLYNAGYLIILICTGGYFYGLVGVTTAITISSVINYTNMVALIRRTYKCGYDIFYKQIIDAVPIFLVTLVLIFPLYELLSFSEFIDRLHFIGTYLPMIISFVFFIFLGGFILKRNTHKIDPLLLKIITKMPIASKIFAK